MTAVSMETTISRLHISEEILTRKVQGIDNQDKKRDAYLGA